MGVADRDYYRKEGLGGWGVAAIFQSAVGTLIATNVLVWIVQVATGGKATEHLAATPEALLHFKLWRLVTANFAHDPTNAMHLFWNMLFLYFFGREVERIYGKRDFFILYLAAGVLGILAELALRSSMGTANLDQPVLGASAAVMAVVVIFTCFYPTHQILFLFFIPAPVWLLCAIFVSKDFIALFREGESGVANLAHLTGAAVGLLYRFADLRWVRLRRYLQIRRRHVQPARKREGRVAVSHAPEPSRGAAVPDPVSLRIDELLEKIHVQGKESLTAEEWEFLRENSSRYRSL